jgi:thiol-disulfide isomerase/thioredoxin
MRIACGLLLVMGTACATKVGAAPPSSPSHLHGEPMPTPRGQLVQGSELNDAAMQGKVVVVKFFAEYCRPCQRTLPEAARLAKQYADTLFVGVAVDDSEIAVARQIRRFALPFTILHDTGNASVGRFRVAELPATFVADTDGEIVWVGGPEQPEEALARVLAALNAGNTPPGPP